MKSPNVISATENNAVPGSVVKKTSAVKEGHVSKIASRFQSPFIEEVAPIKPKPFRITSSPEKVTSPSKKKSVTRTESHHARFNNARAMFEKMGSAEELDISGPPASAANPAARASSVGRTSSRSSEEKSVSNEANNVNNNNNNNSSAYFRSRSSSPRRSSVNNSNNVTNGSSAQNGNGSAMTSSASYQNGLSDSTVGIVKSRRLSFQQKQQELNSETTNGSSPVSTAGKQPISSDCDRDRVKELTNRQRNWFPSFEKQRNNESVDSSRRTSVKNDNTPNLISSPKPDVETPVTTSASAKKTPGLSTSSSDSIEDYLRNWKKGGPDTPSSEAAAPPESR